MKEILNCRICDCTGEHSKYIAHETLHETWEPFSYFSCLSCGTLQIEEIPSDLGRHYPSDYYSFSSVRDGKIYTQAPVHKKVLAELLMNQRFQLGDWLLSGRLFPAFLRDFRRLGLTTQSRILDVGCGNGALLRRLRSWGFSSLQGIDPYLKEDSVQSGFSLLSKEIGKVADKFDLVMLHHVIEHVLDPRQTLKKISEVLSNRGIALISMPIAACYAWRKYGSSWFSWDPPRHLHILSHQSLTSIANQAGLKLLHVEYDDCQMCLERSWINSVTPRGAKRDLTIESLLSRQNFRGLSKRLRESGDTDSAAFFFQKN